MFHVLHRFVVYFSFTLTALVIAFNGNDIFGNTNNITSDPDPDVINAENNYLNTQGFFKDNGIIVNFTNQIINPIAVPSLFNSETGFYLLDTIILPANPGPPNNGGSAGWAMFLDLIATSNNINVTQMKTASTAAASTSFMVEVFTRSGTALGGPVGSGPGSSTAGWTSLGTVPAIQGSTSNGISEVFTIPTIVILAGDTVGVALKFSVAGPRYFGTGSPPYSIYSDANLTLVTGDGRSAPFTPTGSFFSSRALTGEIRYVIDTLTGINKISTEIPDGFRLAQNYPNPFNPNTTIEFAIAEKSYVTLKVFNTRGQEVAILANDEYSAGTYRVQWNATGFASGVYFYTLQAENFSQTKKLILIK